MPIPFNDSYLAEIFGSIIDKAQSVLGQGVEHVEAVDLVPLGDGQVKGDQGKLVGFGDAERRVQTGNEVGHLAKADELSGVRIISEMNKC